MATYSTSLKLTLIGDGEQTGTWGSTTNNNLGALLDQAIAGQTTITMANADYTLSNLNGTVDESRNAVIIVTGNQNATYSVIVPSVKKLYMVYNNLSSSATAYIKMSGGTTIQVPNGRTMWLYCTGDTLASWGSLDYVQYAQSLVTGGTITTGAINCTSLTSSGAISGTTGTFSGALACASVTSSGTIFGTTLTSVVSTGTAPFFVNSTTPVTNLSIGGNAATATTASGLTGTPNITVGTVNGTTITASTQFSGPGTGLTGTATSLNIGGNAATATTATTATTASGLTGTPNITVGTIASGLQTITTPTTSSGLTMLGYGLSVTGTLSSTSYTSIHSPLGIRNTSPTFAIYTGYSGTAYTYGFSLGNIECNTFTSNIATGTAPFTVASTTPVANLSIGGNASTATTATNVSGTVAIANGGTGLTSAGTSGYVLASTGSALAYKKLGLGITGEVWNSVTGSRSLSTTYTNSNAYPIMVSVIVNGGGNLTVSGTLTIGSITVATGLEAVGGNQGTTTTITLPGIVPPGVTYSVTTTNASITSWSELY